MAAIKIDGQKIEESFGPLLHFANENVIDLIDQLAAVLKPQAGANELVDQTIELCRKVQNEYNNGFLTTLNDTVEEFKKVIDIGEYLNKMASVGTVSNLSTAVETDKIDPDSVKM